VGYPQLYNMKLHLSTKLVFLYLFLNVSMFLLLNVLGFNLLEKNLIDEKKNILYNEATSISSSYATSYYKKEITLDYLTTQNKTRGSILKARIWLVNKNGMVISDTNGNGAKVNAINILDIDPTFFDNTFSVSPAIEGVLSEPMLSVSYPVAYSYQIQGYIVIHTPIRLILEKCTSFIDIINICFLVFNLLLLLVFLIIHYIIIHPLNKLNKAALKYTQGDYSYPLNLKKKDEFGTLSNSISYMAAEIGKLDDYQKKFIANISHDFRSPLTSIKGYAEALQDGTIPFEMKDKYLGIIIFETERLNKLTTSLLALNSFENRGTFLEIISFDINHIIKKTAESFEGICNEKKITLNLIFSSKETFVDADMGKIQQVLYNLLDNAIKFSHHNSIIKVTTTEKGDKIFISVKDYGIGIPKDSIKKIWERFYKSDSSRGKDKKGTGLGLSITKDIITAHNENINVISTEGVGSEFIFSLTKSLDY
jgi:signal transduction histidine kinase